VTTENTIPNDTSTDASAAVEDTALGAAATMDGGKEGEETPVETPETPSEGEDGDKPAETPATPEGAPDDYDTAAWAMPEGVEFDAEGFTELEPVLRDLNLSQDAAGKLVSAYAEKIVPLIQRRTLEEFDNQAAELRASLARDLQADPEVGGKNLDESRALAAKAIAHFIPNPEERSEFSTFLNESGLGNQKHLLRIVAGSGRLLSEASTMAASTASQPLTEAQKFYGKG
jgi:hypothetical protein